MALASVGSVGGTDAKFSGCSSASLGKDTSSSGAVGAMAAAGAAAAAAGRFMPLPLPLFCFGAGLGLGPASWAAIHPFKVLPRDRCSVWWVWVV